MAGESNRSLVILALSTAIAKAGIEDEKGRVRGALYILEETIKKNGGDPVKFEP